MVSRRFSQVMGLLGVVALAAACGGDDHVESTSGAPDTSGSGAASAQGGAGGSSASGGNGGATSSGSASGGMGSGGTMVGGPFPTADGNVFSIQYRNSTEKPITVWLEGSQPPCSQAQATQCFTFVQTGETPADYEKKWDKLDKDGVFAASGTVFERIDTDQSVKTIAVSNRIDLPPGQTLRITPPIVDGKPQWYWAQKDGNMQLVASTAGVKAWVTQKGADMPASERTLLYEYNLTPNVLYWDLSAVDGLNANATMSYEGPGCGSEANCSCNRPMPRVCQTNIDAFEGDNGGCPYIIAYGGANTCPNPKFYESIDANKQAPSWVVPRAMFTAEPVSSQHTQIWTEAGSPSGAEMASAPSGNTKIKPAYHIWWSKNPVGQAWLNYLQKNKAGACNAYGWAYDEKKYKDGDSFDTEGNPPDNTAIEADVQCDFKSDSYINIDILKVM